MGKSSLSVHSTKYLHYMVGASAALVLVYVMNLAYFRPSDTQAVTTPPAPISFISVTPAATVVCGSPDPLLTFINTSSQPYNKKFSYGASAAASTQQLASCSATEGGIVKYLAIRRSLEGKNVTYRVKVDGATLIEIANANERGNETLPPVGWSIGKNLITTNVPIKFNSTLVVEASTQADPKAQASTFYIASHVMYEPLTKDDAYPVKFLKPQEVKYEAGTTPTVNIGNTPTVNIGGQPIHTVTP